MPACRFRVGFLIGIVDRVQRGEDDAVVEERALASAASTSASIPGPIGRKRARKRILAEEDVGDPRDAGQAFFGGRLAGLEDSEEAALRLLALRRPCSAAFGSDPDRLLARTPSGTDGTMPRSAATYQRSPFFTATMVERPPRAGRILPAASRMPLISKEPSAIATSRRRKRRS